ncbi:biotin--[acetyl-CoA-carboxylase] ligase [Catellatospora methionotrophica]|uniref:biotin--[biotin carboxyl-carrier protein] ligase n=1 Tax=Catellatospora methionotrophica TaxID=121620 RepID=A0A8J3L7T8_9ACTN|nr:biotin--[acetyl-CoA-carboxylase] ligase [Catellatospora methionotrophica]GIG16002.1 biotin--[acetyl-CoA-carboxylase] ligase [Catellatospora methionotrophica]
MEPSRSPLEPDRLAVLTRWQVEVLAQTGSTNADVAAAARDGAGEGLVVTAEAQTAGRGRLGRTWVSPPRAGLAVSVLLRPAPDVSRWGWLPLLAGVALAEAVRAVTGLESALKWPNDLLIGGGKCAGLLAEVPVPGVVVIGIGLNVSLTADELPDTPTGLPATSLLLAGAAQVDRTELLAVLLERLGARYDAWRQAGGDPDTSGLRDAYLRLCGTLGRQVSVILPGATDLTGEAVTVDTDGRLVVRTGAGDRPVAAGDVVHLR